MLVAGKTQIINQLLVNNNCYLVWLGCKRVSGYFLILCGSCLYVSLLFYLTMICSLANFIRYNCSFFFLFDCCINALNTSISSCLLFEIANFLSWRPIIESKSLALLYVYTTTSLCGISSWLWSHSSDPSSPLNDMAHMPSSNQPRAAMTQLSTINCDS